MNDLLKCTEVRRSGGRFGLFAVCDILKGSTAIYLEGTIQNFPTRYTIQLGPGKHLAPFSTTGVEPRSAWRFLNHHCNPNTRIDTVTLRVIAARDIKAGEELAFNYLATEYELAEPFQCSCGSTGCSGWIRGNKFLSGNN
jgi:hypothetical protein